MAKAHDGKASKSCKSKKKSKRKNSSQLCKAPRASKKSCKTKASKKSRTFSARMQEKMEKKMLRKLKQKYSCKRRDGEDGENPSADKPKKKDCNFGGACEKGKDKKTCKKKRKLQKMIKCMNREYEANRSQASDTCFCHGAGVAPSQGTSGPPQHVADPKPKEGGDDIMDDGEGQKDMDKNEMADMAEKVRVWRRRKSQLNPVNY